MITLKYPEIMGQAFSQAMQKITSTPTHGDKAAAIYKLTKNIQNARDSIVKEYQKTIVETFGKRDDKGSLVRPDNQPMGFEPMEDKLTELQAAQDAFDSKSVELDVPPLSLAVLADVRLSAQDLEALKGAYSGVYISQGGPGVPENVASLR